jgi:hypothetical protein
MAEIKTMSVKEFREQGYLQELNRRILHPLGLALEVVQQGNHQEYFGRIWDYRDDPEGIVFDEGMIDAAKTDAVEDEFAKRAQHRIKKYGFISQPARHHTTG